MERFAHTAEKPAAAKATPAATQASVGTTTNSTSAELTTPAAPTSHSPDSSSASSLWRTSATVVLTAGTDHATTWKYRPSDDSASSPHYTCTRPFRFKEEH